MAIFSPRFYSDAFVLPGGVASAYITGGGPPASWTTVQIDQVGVPFLTLVNAPDQAKFLRAVANPAGNILVAGQAGNLGDALIYGDELDSWTTGALAFGQNGLAVGWNGSNFVIIHQESSLTYARIVVGGATQTGIPIPAPPTTQGILMFQPGATLASDVTVWTDNATFRVVNGLNLKYAVEASGVWAGQYVAAGQSVAALPDGSISLVCEEEGQNIRIASNGAAWIVVSWLLNGRGFEVIAPPWPNLTPGSGGGSGGSGGGSGSGGAPPGGGTIFPLPGGSTGLAKLARQPAQRNYHETDKVSDPFAQRALRLIWDRLYQNEDMIKATDAKFGAVDTSIAAAQRRADQAFLQTLAPGAAASGKTTVTGPNPPPDGTPVGGDPPPGDANWDGGQGNSGLNAAGANGHTLTAGASSYYQIGQIVGGTGNEFPALLAPAGSGAARDANLNELLGRIIWHLQQAGFDAGKNQNPSGATGRDNFTVRGIDSLTRGWDIFISTNFSEFGDPSQQATLQMLPMEPQETVYLPDGGIAD